MPYVSSTIASHLSLTKITEREQEVLYLIANEYTSGEIAQKLYISNHTVVCHRKRLLEKLHVKNTAGLVRRAFELGYLLLPAHQYGSYHQNH